MNGKDHARLWNSNSATELAVSLKPGVSIAQGKHAVEKALPIGSALAVKTDSEQQTEAIAVLGNTLSRLNDTTIVVLIATVTSVIALMLAAVSQRQGRLNTLTAIGMSAGQLARLIFYETGLILISGCLLGAIAGIAGQDLIDGWLQQGTGAPVRFAPAWQFGLRTITIAIGVSLLASMVAVLRTIRLQPTTAFSTE
jgi:putative ABC transport system permease protein